MLSGSLLDGQLAFTIQFKVIYGPPEMSDSYAGEQLHSTEELPRRSEEGLKPPPVGGMEDPGARELDTSEDEDEHFSDASEGRRSPAPGQCSPIPTTRLEKVDGGPSYGEVPGTSAYEMRKEDAVPDEVEIIRDSGHGGKVTEQPTTSRGQPIPLTVVEKIDPLTPSHGEVPGTDAHEIRKADAVPDLVLKIPEPGAESEAISRSRSPSPSTSTPGDQPVPITKLSRVDSLPSHREVSGTRSSDKRREDADPDVVERSPDVDSRGSPTPSINRSTIHTIQSHARRWSSGVKQAPSASSPTAAGSVDGVKVEEYDENEDGDQVNEDFGDDFDDFEEGGEGEDFGDFDDGFQQDTSFSERDIRDFAESQLPMPTVNSAFRILDFSEMDDPNTIEAVVMEGMSNIYPIDDNAKAALVAPLPRDNTVFLTERSLSLWSQLVAPPPLQPPDWVRSRIRRLFLVSLGVPVDLDEILPASKQKKLILPSTHIHSSSNRSSPRLSSDLPNSPMSRLKQSGKNLSTASINSSSSQRQRSPSGLKRKGPPPPPELDIPATRMLCSTTDAALANLMDEELTEHVKQLAALTEYASEVLEYWLKRKDAALGDKEAFEGVIENLVKHARKVRK